VISKINPTACQLKLADVTGSSLRAPYLSTSILFHPISAKINYSYEIA